MPSFHLPLPQLPLLHLPLCHLRLAARLQGFVFDLDAQQQREPRLMLGQPSIGLFLLCLSLEATMVLHLALLIPLHLNPDLSTFIHPHSRILDVAR